MATAVPSIADRYFAAWNGRESEAVSAILADEFVWEDPSLPAPMSHPEEAFDFLERSWRSFPDLRFDLLGAPMVVGARVAQEWRMTGTHQAEGVPAGVPGTGRAIDVSGVDIFSLGDDRRIVRIQAFYDAMTLAAQLGLLPAR
ncbi:MAG: hypothetical protein QOF76_1501 [Solirubrobacteraceae bacterium]|jgi:steroid delta-isomerase-like uncharacterized protein|nr:hypothetical protein [Solirubrobacteraceae bacterium]